MKILKGTKKNEIDRDTKWTSLFSSWVSNHECRMIVVNFLFVSTIDGSAHFDVRISLLCFFFWVPFEKVIILLRCSKKAQQHIDKYLASYTTMGPIKKSNR